MFDRTTLLALATTTLLAPAAWAGHADDRFLPPNRIVAAADDLVDATRHMQRLVEHWPKGHRGRSGDLLYALDRLEQQARHFRKDAVRGVGPRHLEHQFDELFGAFRHAEREMRFVRSERLQRDFDCVVGAMHELARDVEIAAGPVKPRRGRGPHGAIVLGDRGWDPSFQVRIRF